jgi:hypothetical protein
MEPFNPAGMTVTVTYSNGSTTTVSGGDPDLTYDYDFSSIGYKQVKVFYGGLEAMIASNVISVLSLNDRVAAAASTATIRLYADETISVCVAIGSKNITLVGDGAVRTVKRQTPYTANMFSVGANGSLTLDANVTVDGSGVAANGTLVDLGANNCTLTMKAGSKLTGNRRDTPVTAAGGAVTISAGTGCTFIMDGGEISGNHAHQAGGGVSVITPTGTFIMNGGVIKNNTIGNDEDGHYGADVLIISATAAVNISGNAELGNISLFGTGPSAKSSITAAANFTGSVEHIDLVGNGGTFAGTKNIWITGSPVIVPASGVTLTKALLDRFGLWYFRSADNADTEKISPTYHLYGTGAGEDTPAEMGKLVN